MLGCEWRGRPAGRPPPNGGVEAEPPARARLRRLLEGDTFLRIHRSTIVNFDRVREIQPWFHGEYIALLADGTKLVVSHAYASRLRELMG